MKLSEAQRRVLRALSDGVRVTGDSRGGGWYWLVRQKDGASPVRVSTIIALRRRALIVLDYVSVFITEAKITDAGHAALAEEEINHETHN